MMSGSGRVVAVKSKDCNQARSLDWATYQCAMWRTSSALIRALALRLFVAATPPVPSDANSSHVASLRRPALSPPLPGVRNTDANEHSNFGTRWRRACVLSSLVSNMPREANTDRDKGEHARDSSSRIYPMLSLSLGLICSEGGACHLTFD